VIWRRRCRRRLPALPALGQSCCPPTCPAGRCLCVKEITNPASDSPLVPLAMAGLTYGPHPQIRKAVKPIDARARIGRAPSFRFGRTSPDATGTPRSQTPCSQGHPVAHVPHPLDDLVLMGPEDFVSPDGGVVEPAISRLRFLSEAAGGGHQPLRGVPHPLEYPAEAMGQPPTAQIDRRQFQFDPCVQARASGAPAHGGSAAPGTDSRDRPTGIRLTVFGLRPDCSTSANLPRSAPCNAADPRRLKEYSHGCTGGRGLAPARVGFKYNALKSAAASL